MTARQILEHTADVVDQRRKAYGRSGRDHGGDRRPLVDDARPAGHAGSGHALHDRPEAGAARPRSRATATASSTSSATPPCSRRWSDEGDEVPSAWLRRGASAASRRSSGTAGTNRACSRSLSTTSGSPGRSASWCASWGTSCTESARSRPMTEWTREMVEERIVEAAAVLKRLPGLRSQGYFRHMAGDPADREGDRRRHAETDAAAASEHRGDHPHGRGDHLEPVRRARRRHPDVGARQGVPWKQLCHRFGISRPTAIRRLGTRSASSCGD